MIINGGWGNLEFINLFRKFNIVIEGSWDNFVYVEINDVVFVLVYWEGIFGFNVVVGGFFFFCCCEVVIFFDVWV